MRVELDKSSIFALASDTRLEIMKALKPMRRTVSQLSEQLSIDKGAVHRHLKKMEEGGLVKRFEDHGFVYYGLTWMARDLLVPNENTRVVIVLSATWILSLAFIFVVAAGLLSQGGNDSLIDILPIRGDEGSSVNFDDEKAASPIDWMLPAIVLGAIIAILSILAVKMLRPPFQQSPEKSEAVEISAESGGDPD